MPKGKINTLTIHEVQVSLVVTHNSRGSEEAECTLHKSCPIKRLKARLTPTGQYYHNYNYTCKYVVTTALIPS